MSAAKDRTQHLGKYTELGATEQREWRDYLIQSRYKDQDVAREILPDFRVSKCLHIPIPRGAIGVWKDTKTGRAHLKGVAVCGSVWTCPICSTRIGIGRRKELQEGIEKARDKGLKVLFVTFTVRHSRDDALADLLTDSKAAMRFMKRSRSWRKLKEEIGLVGTVDSVEVRWSFASGWHPHFHTLYFVSKDNDLEEVESKIYDLWFHALTKQGMDCSREHGVKVVCADNQAADYMTKWTLDAEITGGQDKQGRGDSYSPVQLLRLYRNNEQWAGKLFRDFALATKGLASFRWGRGLRDELGMATALSDEELAEAEESDHSVQVAPLSREQFKALLYTGRPGIIGELLTVAERGGKALFLWLATLGITTISKKDEYLTR